MWKFTTGTFIWGCGWHFFFLEMTTKSSKNMLTALSKQAGDNGFLVMNHFPKWKYACIFSPRL